MGCNVAITALKSSQKVRFTGAFFEVSTEESDFAIANVSCQYDSPSDGDQSPRPVGHHGPALDHTYDTRDEPPAFIIHSTSSLNQASSGAHPFMEVCHKALGVGGPVVNVIHVGDPHQTQMHQPGLYMGKRIRRSENVLRQAAECVSRGSTFQTVSEQFNIPISTIRFFMARKGILPRRRRGRSAQITRSPEPAPPFHIQHYKLPDMVALKGDSDDTNNS